jgi:hypothetical protein
MHLGLAPACERHIWPVVIITLASFLIIGAYSCQVSKDFDVALTAGTQTEELPTPLLLHLCLQFRRQPSGRRIWFPTHAWGLLAHMHHICWVSQLF